MLQKNRKPAQEEETDTTENDTAQENDHAPREEYQDIIDEYKDEARRREATPRVQVFKFDHDKSGQDNMCVGYFSGEDVPNKHQIGLKFGAGRYRVQGVIPKGKNKSNNREDFTTTFRLHPVYDEYHRDFERQRINKAIAPAGAAPGITPAANSPTESIVLMKEMFAMILPLMRANQTAAAAAAQQTKESPAELFNTYAIMQKLLKANLFDTAETYREFNRRYQTGPGEDIQDAEAGVTDEKEGGSLLEKIIAMIEPFFGLIASKSPTAAIAAQGLKAAPQFVEILNDPQLCRMIVSHFDRTKGREKSDIALKNIGINRAQLFARGAAAAGPAQGTGAPKSASPAANPTPRQQRPDKQQ